MKKIFPLVVVFLTIGLAQYAFKSPVKDGYVQGAETVFHSNLDLFTASLPNLLQAIIDCDGSPSSVSHLQENLRTTRHHFKTVEPLFAYYFRAEYELYFNGAPLPKLEPNVPEVVVIEPKGLQTIDELVYVDDILAEQEKLIDLANRLMKDTEKVNKIRHNYKIYDRNVLEAARQGIMRVATLGITGFDTPGSGDAIPEASVAMKSIQTLLIPFKSRMEELGYAKSIFENLDASIAFLKANNDFESFDRAFFIRAFVNPLFKDIKDFHIESGIEHYAEITTKKASVNYYADNLFSDDLLERVYFAELYKPEYNDKTIALGRTLFFDPILSSNIDRSCASCHDPNKAFADGNIKSIASGFEGTVSRNAPTVLNSVYANRWFYDMRAIRLDQQMAHVIYDEKEFNTDYSELMKRLESSPTYQQLFDEAYGNNRGRSINRNSINHAMRCYITSLASWNSPFDQYMRGETEEISEEAYNGFNVFMGKGACATCHFAPTFSGTVPPLYVDSESEILGLPTEHDTSNLVLDSDIGRIGNRIRAEESEIYRFSFKTPTVRNIELTGPYMHNGAYENLEQVMDFYNKGGGAGMGLDVPYQTLPPDHLNLSQKEISDVIAFMHTLTDTVGMTMIPNSLPEFPDNPEWNNRTIGGDY